MLKYCGTRTLDATGHQITIHWRGFFINWLSESFGHCMWSYWVSGTNSTVHDLAFHALFLTRFQHDLYNTEARCLNDERIIDVELLNAVAQMLTILIRIPPRRLERLTRRRRPLHFSSHRWPYRHGKNGKASCNLFHPLHGWRQTKAAILPSLFRKQPSNHALSVPSASGRFDDHW